MKLKLQKRTIVVILLFLAAALGIYKFTLGSGIKTIPVKKVEMQKRVVEKTISVSGKVKAEKDAVLSFGTSGRLAAIKIKEGDEVKENQLLAYLDTYTLKSNLDAAKLSLDIARTDRDIFIENYKTHVDAIGGEDEYYLGVRKQNETVEKAEATYRAARGGLADGYIYSPINGKVIEISKEEGESVIIGETVAHVADLTNLFFEISLDQEDFGQVKNGMISEITLDSFPNTPIEGQVIYLQDFTTEDQDNDFKIKLSLKEDTNIVPRLGMTGDALLLVEKTDQEVDALIYDEIFYDEENNPYVWILDGGTIKRRYIEIGLEGDIYTEIKTPINMQIVVGVDPDTEILEGYRAKLAE